MDDWKFKPGQKMSNKNPCHCGSGRHYKDCCKSKDLQAAHTSIKNRNLAFAECIRKIRFQSGDPTNWKEIGAFLSYHPEYVVKIYEDDLDLWQKVSFDDLMQSDEVVSAASTQQLTTVYAADPQPYSLVNNIKRMSTYLDKIIVIDPFHKSFFFNENYSPLIFPDKWVSNTLKMMYFMTFLEPWIRDDIVILIPNPGDLNHRFRDDMEKLASERLKGKPIRLGTGGPEGDYSDILDLARELASDSDSSVESFLRRMGETSDRKISEFMDLVKSVRQYDPLVFRGKMPEKSWTLSGPGINAEMHINLSNYLGAFPSTFSNIAWEGLFSVTEESQTIVNEWLPFTRTLQELSLPFFDGVDNTIALELRREGYLSDIRKFFRQVWLASGGDYNKQIIADMTKELGSVYNITVKQSKDMEIDFSKKRWGHLKTDVPEILNDLGFDILYGYGSGLAPPLSNFQDAALIVLGSVVLNIGRSIIHKIIWPHWKLRKISKNPAALFFIRLDRSNRTLIR